MLVLSRKHGEAIRIGEGVEVTILGVSRGRVKLGFRAPQGVAIQRAEVAELATASSSEFDPAKPEVDGGEIAASPRFEELHAAFSP